MWKCGDGMMAVAKLRCNLRQWKLMRCGARRCGMVLWGDLGVVLKDEQWSNMIMQGGKLQCGAMLGF